MTIHRRNLLLSAASILPLGHAHAQAGYPTHPIKVIAPVATGSGADTLMRRLEGPLVKLLGQSLIIENKPGAQSALGARIAAKAPHDGYTLFLGGNSFVANVHMMREPGYDPVKDFAPISLLVYNPLLLTVRANLPARTLQEFIKYAKDRPGKLSYGVGNSGSLVASQLLNTQTGIDAVGVNYPGMAQATTDLIAERLDYIMLDPVIAGPFIQAGKLRALGITSRQRLTSMPDIAPLSELGVPGYEWMGWVGLFAPAGTPAPVRRRLSQAVEQVLGDAGVREFMVGGGMIPARATTEQFQAHMQEQIKLWGRWTRAAGLTPT